jgi:hypothetical protein
MNTHLQSRLPWNIFEKIHTNTNIPIYLPSCECGKIIILNKKIALIIKNHEYLKSMVCDNLICNRNKSNKSDIKYEYFCKPNNSAKLIFPKKPNTFNNIHIGNQLNHFIKIFIKELNNFANTQKINIITKKEFDNEINKLSVINFIEWDRYKSTQWDDLISGKSYFNYCHESKNLHLFNIFMILIYEEKIDALIFLVKSGLKFDQFIAFELSQYEPDGLKIICYSLLKAYLVLNCIKITNTQNNIDKTIFTRKVFGNSYLNYGLSYNHLLLDYKKKESYTYSDIINSIDVDNFIEDFKKDNEIVKKIFRIMVNIQILFNMSNFTYSWENAYSHIVNNIFYIDI